MSPEPTSFLYPFIDAEERDVTRLLSDLAASAQAKAEESDRLRRATLQDCESVIEAAAGKMADHFRAGGRLFVFGNGGSATDADGTVALFRHPPSGRSLPAISLVDDRAVLTALANDVGYELVFSRQIIAYGRAGDIAIGFSTSGASVNVIRAIEEAARRQLLTIGLCGYDGGAMASSTALDYCLVVRSDSVHRIQEVQDAATLAMWQAVQRHLAPAEQPSP
jgi:D-sedoheptulose 7-phosphate isomerase